LLNRGGLEEVSYRQLEAEWLDLLDVDSGAEVLARYQPWFAQLHSWEQSRHSANSVWRGVMNLLSETVVYLVKLSEAY